MLEARIIDDTRSIMPLMTETIDLITDRAAIRSGIGLIHAIELFQDDSDLRVLPVIDEEERPIGAIFERDIRRILFNPFGHALLKNPSFGLDLDRHIRACPMAEADTPTDSLIDIYAAQKERCEGIIITSGGRFRGVIAQQSLLQIAANRQTAIAQQKAERFERINDASRKFRNRAAALAADLMATSEQLGNAASEMAVSARHNGQQSTVVAASARQTATHMQEIADRGRALASTLRSVEDEAGNALRIAGNAVELVSRSATYTRTLTDEAEEIESVISLIDSIAMKTNMLALNATIVAAHAGDAGRGFAVVAAEVKSLAAQTRSAAAGIGTRIERIRKAVLQVFESHNGMESAIASVDAMSASIITAIKVQSAATQVIADNADEAGRATDDLRGSADHIRGNATQAEERADDVHTLAGSISARAQNLQENVNSFLTFVLSA